MSIYSSPEQLRQIKHVLFKYSRLPFSLTTIPGAVMEAVLAHVRQADVLNTYDYVDVIDKTARIGWQVKSTKAKTPVTWKRAKIQNSVDLIEHSHDHENNLQKLGDAIIDFCNIHAHESIEKYDLDQIGYSRLIIHDNGEVKYFERLLCSRAKPNIFNKEDFYWVWSKQKQTTKKEQLSALHGFHKKTKKKWWAWHGLGENQLHFSGEQLWWPDSPDDITSFNMPDESSKLTLDQLFDLLDTLDE